MQPGHVFPLIAQPGGVLVRAGHTEACCDLARLAGLTPAAVLCEIMNDDGTMARLPGPRRVRARARASDRHDRRPHPPPQPHRAPGRAHRRAPAHDAARRVPARRLSRQAHRRDAPRAGARADLARHRDAGARARAAVGDGPARRRRARRTRGAFPRRSPRSREAGRGVVVLLHRPESAAELRRARDRRRRRRRRRRWTCATTASARRSCATSTSAGCGCSRKPRKMPSMAGFDLEVTGYRRAAAVRKAVLSARH